jgi:FkbM family methyltransferase
MTVNTPMNQPTNTEAQSHRSQFDEDRLLTEIFGDRTDGYCVEIGAYDGRTGSASYPFEQRGWHCLVVEPIPALVEEIRRHRACRVVSCAASDEEGTAKFFVAEKLEQMSTLDLTPDRREWIEQLGGAVEEITVRTATLDSLLAEAGFPEIQFATIDVEGHELAVLEGFTLEKHRPRIVIVEDNSVSDDPRSSGGDPRVGRHMSEHGYVHFRRTGVNEWYAHESDTALVRPDELRRFERAKVRQRRRRARKFFLNRVATNAGAHLPAPVKRRVRQPFDRLRAKRSRG